MVVVVDIAVVILQCIFGVRGIWPGWGDVVLKRTPVHTRVKAIKFNINRTQRYKNSELNVSNHSRSKSG